MAAAAPRLSDYEEFKEYELQKSDFDRDIIRGSATYTEE